MKLISRVVILAVCVLMAYSLPEDIETFQAQTNCNAQYQQQQQFINAQISSQTTQCVAVTNATMNQTLVQLAPQANLARDNLTALESNLHNCTSMSDNLEFVNCVNTDYKENKQLLDTGSAIAINVQDQATKAFYNAQQIQQSCIGNVLQKAGNNFTIAAEEYQNCMAAIYNPSN